MSAITHRTRYRVDAYLTAEELTRLDRVAMLKDLSRAGFVRDTVLDAVAAVERVRGLGPVLTEVVIATARSRSPTNNTASRRKARP